MFGVKTNVTFLNQSTNNFGAHNLDLVHHTISHTAKTSTAEKV